MKKPKGCLGEGGKEGLMRVLGGRSDHEPLYHPPAPRKEHPPPLTHIPPLHLRRKRRRQWLDRQLKFETEANIRSGGGGGDGYNSSFQTTTL
jgi:hypothetical protein